MSKYSKYYLRIFKYNFNLQYVVAFTYKLSKRQIRTTLINITVEVAMHNN